MYGHVTGYGAGDGRPGYDAVIQAEAGFAYMTGEPGGGPCKMPVALVDLLAAHQLKEAVLPGWPVQPKTRAWVYAARTLNAVRAPRLTPVAAGKRTSAQHVSRGRRKGGLTSAQHDFLAGRS